MGGVKERDPTAFYQKDVFGKPTHTCTSTIELLTRKYYDEDDEAKEKCKGLKLTRSALVQSFKEFYEIQEPTKILEILLTKLQSFDALGDLLVTYASENGNRKDVAHAVRKISLWFEAQRTINEVVASNNKLKACVLVFLHNHKVIYPNLPRHLLETQYNSGCYIRVLQIFERLGVIQRLNGDDEQYRFQRKKIEIAFKKAQKKVYTWAWYGVTEIGEVIIGENYDSLAAILPTSVLERATGDFDDVFKIRERSVI